MNDPRTNPGDRKTSSTGKAVALGAGAGMVFGAAFANPGAGMVIGAALGLVVGYVLERAG